MLTGLLAPFLQMPFWDCFCIQTQGLLQETTFLFHFYATPFSSLLWKLLMQLCDYRTGWLSNLIWYTSGTLKNLNISLPNKL